MKFNEKLQTLRKRKNLTQDDLAKMLFVSRTAVSKWESGRGYPNIDSLKQIAALFSITVDDLLSSDELLTAAKHKENNLLNLVFSLLDISTLLLLFLPFFAQNEGGIITAVSLLGLTQPSGYLITFYFVITITTTLFGIITLIFKSQNHLGVKSKRVISIILGVIGVFVFIISRQPYATLFVFVFLILKALIVILNNE